MRAKQLLAYSNFHADDYGHHRDRDRAHGHVCGHVNDRACGRVCGRIYGLINNGHVCDFSIFIHF
jgi:hypothetical protein